MSKIQIRNNVFETNSSMTHSLTICTKDEYNAFNNGELAYIGDAWGSFPPEWKNKEFIPVDELMAWVHEQEETEGIRFSTEDICSEYCIYPDMELYEGYHDELEFYEREFTTPSGDQMVAFGVYGHD